ncbi:MAG: ABC transporter ATP-binding protein, partial [Chloroflexi bacterium]|nr:ABC transporter ATP-binding protein [Chloroflexota bacterium]
MSALLEVENLKTHIFTRRGVVKAVDGVTFSVDEGETFGLVGESGCGKTMTALSILKLVPRPGGRIVGGKIIFDGEDIVPKREAEMRRIRGRRISMILQDSMTSLNPAYT